jgi:hypothetical protein
MFFWYCEVSQPNYLKTSVVNALARLASEHLNIPAPQVRWFREDDSGPLHAEVAARPAGFVGYPTEIWIDVNCSGRWLAFTALHEVRHAKQRFDHPEDIWSYSTYPEGLKQRIEETANEFAESFMTRSEFLATIQAYQAIGGLEIWKLN